MPTPKTPGSDIPPRRFTEDQLVYAAKRGVSEEMLQTKNRQAILDGVDASFIRLVVTCRGGVDVKRKDTDV